LRFAVGHDDTCPRLAEYEERLEHAEQLNAVVSGFQASGGSVCECCDAEVKVCTNHPLMSVPILELLHERHCPMFAAPADTKEASA
jgi:hypothetical protein